MGHVERMCDLSFNPKLFETFHCGTALDELLSTHQGLPRGVNYMIIGDPGVGKTTIILDMLANVQQRYPKARILFISAEMNEIDLTVYVERYPKFQTLNILFIESDFDNEVNNWEIIKEEVEKGWDIVAIDSFYELQGIIKDEENTIWDTYNTLTAFASHTTLWERHDYRRISIMNDAVHFLRRKPDIMTYYDLYQAPKPKTHELPLY